MLGKLDPAYAPLQVQHIISKGYGSQQHLFEVLL
jgi:hypothetical protein